MRANKKEYINMDNHFFLIFGAAKKQAFTEKIPLF